jgi:hypothetical protein
MSSSQAWVESSRDIQLKGIERKGLKVKRELLNYD